MTTETTHEVKPKVSKIGEHAFIEFRCEGGSKLIRANTITGIIVGGLDKATIVCDPPTIAFSTIHEYQEAVDALKAALGTD